MKKANKVEEQIAADEAEMRSLTTGEVLRAKKLSPLVMVRSPSAGNHTGYLVRVNEQARCAEILEGSNLWRWSGRNSLREVCLYGIPPQEARVSEIVPGTYVVYDIAEILPVSKEAEKSLRTPVWT